MKNKTDISEELLKALEKQKQYMRASNYTEYENNSAEIERLVQRLSQENPLKSINSIQQKKILKSFEELTLIVSAHKQNASDQLQKINHKRRTVTAYQRLS